MKKLTNKEFLSKAVDVFGLRYDYSKVNYVHSLQKVEIVCAKHGSFLIKPSNHINNKQGCPLCGNEATANCNKIGKEDFIKSLENKAGKENYDLSKIHNIKSLRDVVEVTCALHGEYRVEARDIKRSNFWGCKKCKIQGDRFTKDQFINKSSEAHRDFYTYDKTEYSTAHSRVIVTCPIHGDFEVTPHTHIKGNGFCPKCTDYVSSYELELHEFLKLNGIEIESSFRKFGKNGIKEIDIISHDKKIGIEINGLYWHSEKFKSKDFHKTKSENMKKLGYHLIHIFEDDWKNKKDICKSIILNSFGEIKNKIHARKCHLKIISNEDCSRFLVDNHIQGDCKSRVKIGLFFESELVSVMIFGALRKCLGSKSKEGNYELLRFCSKKFFIVNGGATKMFSFFIKNFTPDKVISYCDSSRGVGEVYKTMGFSLVSESAPNYFYVKNNRRFSRFSFRKDALLKLGCDPKDTEKNFMKNNGFLRIYDCGSLKFEWVK